MSSVPRKTGRKILGTSKLAEAKKKIRMPIWPRAVFELPAIR